MLLALLQLSAALAVHFGVLIDAGSTATTLYVYSWSGWAGANTTVKQIDSTHSSQPLHLVNTSEILAVVQPLLTFAASVIPEDGISKTTVYLKATAGMRALQAADPAKADSIIATLRTILSQTRFNFDPKRELIMPGNQQAAFSWLAAWYFLRNESVAAIDLGSLSLGVAYLPVEAPFEGYFPFHVGDEIFGLFTHNFLGYGKDTASERYLHALNSTRLDPCLWSGATRTNFSGSGNFSQCHTLVSSILFSSQVFCSVPPCSIDGVAAPKLPPQTKVFAMNAFSPVSSFFGCERADDILACLSTAAIRDCALNYSEVVSQHEATPYLSSMCFDAAFILEALRALNIPKIYSASSSIDNMDVGWALGAMIYEIGLDNVLYDTTAPATNKSYGILMDAGSTGTRCYVYSWDSKDFVNPDTLPVARQVSTEYRVNPGISTLSAQGVAAYLQPFIDYTRPLVPAAQVSHTPIMLMATAGMRSLFLKDPTRAEGIMVAIRTLFAQSGYLFQDSYVTTLPGELEGAYSWLSVLLLLNSSQNATCATVDMGGTSTQLALLPPSLPLASYVPMSIGAKSYDLYAHSYLYYGQNGATDRHRAILLQQNAPNDPCGWLGYVYTDPVTGATLPTTKPDFDECVSTVRDQLLGLKAQCPLGPCGLNGVYSPRIPSEMKIYAFSGFTYLAEFFYTGYEASMRNLHDAAKTLCESKNWTAIKQERNTTSPDIFAPYCFAAAYFYTLIVDGYGVSQDKTLYQYRYISDNAIGWTLGALMYQVGLLRVGLQSLPPTTPAPSLAPAVIGPSPALLPLNNSLAPSTRPSMDRTPSTYSAATGEDSLWMGLGLAALLVAEN